MKLNTIQKRNNLNEVWHTGVLNGPGGACHEYVIIHGKDPEFDTDRTRIKFQTGPRNKSTSIGGVLDVDLLEIVRDRLTAFQAGEFKCRENEIALTHIEEALLWMNKRVEDRYERGVLGTMEK